MNYIIIYDKELVGTIIEPTADHSMGVVPGPFIPLPPYERIRPVFRLFAEAKMGDEVPDSGEKLARYYQALDALDLSVTTADGRPFPVISAHVEDYSAELGDNGYDGFFVVEPDRLFVPTGSFFDDERYWDQGR